nr:RNA-directed DNA polymerase, eukaryota [Tanacetum cinerariifolium]
GKVFWIRAKEVPGWIPELLEELEYDEQSVDGSIEDVNKVTNGGNDGVNSDIDEITETVFDNSSGLKGDKSDDPFGLYSLLNKNAKVKKDKIHSPIYPPGFTPDNEENTKCDMGENFVNGNVDEEIRVDEGVSDNMKSKGDKVESMSTGRNSVGNSGGILCVWDPNAFRKSNHTILDYFVIIGGVWIKSGFDLLIIAVYAPHDSRDKQMLWDYLVHVINQWHGEAIIMGDFNEDRYKSDSAITLDRYLSDHRPILLRETDFDSDRSRFDFFTTGLS